MADFEPEWSVSSPWVSPGSWNRSAYAWEMAIVCLRR